ncbi:MAG: exo-alpha-sialidase [Fuerstiella sp.]|nr:exo-alpha-sialidase [Fuerstiella sp.]MCP4852931.1 exo-alpha-sialidase [Fuerstiella sp.]
MKTHHLPSLVLIPTMVLLVAIIAASALAADSLDWNQLAKEDANQDFTTTIFDGQTPNQLACDTTVRPMPDGSWVTVMLGGGHTEPLPTNRVFISRSRDQGRTWTSMRPIDLAIKSKDPSRAITLSELMLNGKRATMVLQVHNGGFGQWKTYFVHSDDSCHTWSELEPAPGKLADRTMIRNAIKTRDGRILMPYQHYNRCDETGHKISKGRVFHTPRGSAHRRDRKPRRRPHVEAVWRHSSNRRRQLPRLG